MSWDVRFFEDFANEFAAFPEGVRIAVLERARWLEAFGPTLGRPHADTLKGSKHANMKELRFKESGGVWRVAFAFDPDRRAMLLVAGDKSGVGQTAFYKGLIKRADDRFDAHLARVKAAKGKR
jgi:hypothetical protein